MVAMGRAGSAVNLREHVLVVDGAPRLDLATLGAASLGACELFRPAALVPGAPVEPHLRRLLEDAGIRVLQA